ncbi:hypothetical protein FKW77_004288 [Venturia effusa]|uniref:DUF6604 domain-containing protein n=1 Tax=Venturia effusa TaxID=50376 RepID=A0A517LR43_9PEZI|nr:hypothetical protein FKW77_004288 [Venturia effusa]
MSTEVADSVRAYKLDDKLFNVWFVAEAKKTSYFSGNADRVIPISEYNAIALHLKEKVAIPRDILTILGRAIRLRKYVKEIYKLSGKNSEQDAGHETYLNVLKLVQYTLDHHRSAPSKTPGDGKVGAQAMAGVINRDNLYSHLASGSSSESSETVDLTELDKSLPVLPERDPKKEAMITVRGMLIALRSHEQEIHNAWTKVRDESMLACDASVITSLAINSVMTLEADFQQVYKIDLLTTMIKECYEQECAATGLQQPGLKIDILDDTRFSIAEDHYILQFWMIGRMWKKLDVSCKRNGVKKGGGSFFKDIHDIVSNTLSKILLAPVSSLQGEEEPPRSSTYREHLTFAACRLFTIFAVSSRDDGVSKLQRFFYPVFDPLAHLVMKKQGTDGKASYLALAFTLKIYIKIDSILGDRTGGMPAEYEDLCRDEYLKPIDTFWNGIDRARQNMLEEVSKDMLADVLNILQSCRESITTMKDGPPMNKFEEQMRKDYISSDPIIIGLWMAKVQVTFNTGALNCLNRCMIVRDAAHIYSRAKKEGTLVTDWPDMERYLSLQPKHLDYNDKDAQAETVTPLRTLFEENQDTWMEGLDTNKLADTLGLENPDSTTSIITLLQKCRERLTTEQESLSFDYLGFLPLCWRYLERIREATDDEVSRLDREHMDSDTVVGYTFGEDGVRSIRDTFMAALDCLVETGEPTAPLLDAVAKVSSSGGRSKSTVGAGVEELGWR